MGIIKFPGEHCLQSSIVIVGNKASELSKSIRGQGIILSIEGPSQHQIIARLKVSKGAGHGTLICLVESGSVISKV